MKRYKTVIPLVVLLLGTKPAASSQHRIDEPVTSHRDSVMINFNQSKWDLDPNVGDNAALLEGIDRRLTTVFNDSVYRLRSVTVSGGASPEGTVDFNRFLSEHRAETLFGWFDRYVQLSSVDKTFVFHGRDWEGVLRLAEADPSLPYREETLSLLRTIVGEKRALDGKEPEGSLSRMKRLRGGEPYRYLYRNIFPAVRASKVVISYELVPAPQTAPDPVIVRDTVYVERIIEVRDTLYIDLCNKGKRNNQVNLPK